MRIRELSGYTENMIKGKRWELLLLCLLPIGGELLLRSAEAALYSLMLYFGTIRPIDLFTGINTEQTVLSAIFILLRFLIMPPLWCGLGARLMLFAEGKKEPKRLSRYLSSGKFILRSISANFFICLISALFLLPIVAAFALGIYLLYDGAAGAELFVAVNLIALGIFLGIRWIYLRFGLTAVPFLLLKKGELSAFRIVLFTIKFMRHRGKFPLKLILTYLLPVLIIPPYFIPKIAVSYAVGISIFFKEDENAHEQTCIHRSFGKSTAA